MHQVAHRGAGRIEFLSEISQVVLEFSNFDAIELRLTSGELRYRWRARRRSGWSHFEPLPPGSDLAKIEPAHGEPPGWFEPLLSAVIHGSPRLPRERVTALGSFWTGDVAGDAQTLPGMPRAEGVRGSLAIVPMDVGEPSPGVLVLASPELNVIDGQSIETCEAVAQTMGFAVKQRRAQHALRERVKELSCLYSVARILEDPNAALAETLQRAAAALPPAWQHPELLAARIRLDGVAYGAGDVSRAIHRQCATIVVGDRHRGTVEVGYVGDRAEFAEGPFLPEEEHLIRAIAREVGLFVLRVEARQERQRLADQLQHAERLATLGQLAAGLAHSLNEPLGGILGFSQLARKAPDLPKTAADDLDKIIQAALHARDVLRNLMLFARQSPTHRTLVDLNGVLERSLAMLASRLAGGSVRVVRDLAVGRPTIAADEVQIHQVVVNLCVNALQAMPEGGTLTVQTRVEEDFIDLTVRDTGRGMSPEVAQRVFEPFFTTKGPDEGTGLGLSVVQGIVASHGGTVGLESAPGEGTVFRVRFPSGVAIAGDERAGDA